MRSLPIELLLRQLKLSAIVGGSLGFLIVLSFLALVGRAGHFFSLFWIGITMMVLWVVGGDFCGEDCL
jgi:hypothetical protein